MDYEGFLSMMFIYIYMPLSIRQSILQKEIRSDNVSNALLSQIPNLFPAYELTIRSQGCKQ